MAVRVGRGDRTLVTAAIFGTVCFVVFTANAWVELNAFSSRYYFPLCAAGLFLTSAASWEGVRVVTSRVED
jgi:hypothetical protein